MAVDLEIHGGQLLDWLYGQAGGERGYVDVAKFVQEAGLPSDAARLLAEHLEAGGLADAIVASGGRVEAMITTGGVAAAQARRAARADRAGRARNLRQGMMRWLYDQETQPYPPVDWNGFLNSDYNHFLGGVFSVAEVERETEYLATKSLITGSPTDQTGPAWARPQLTEAGRDCVMDCGGNVSDYLARERGGVTNNVTFTEARGNIAIGSTHVVQNHSSGLDTRELMNFANLVRQIAPTLGLGQVQQTDLESQAAQLHEAASKESEPGRLRSLCRAVLDGLALAAPSMASQMATELGDKALRALGG